MYQITVKFYKNYPTCENIQTARHIYYGSFAALYMGKQFASCMDVISVDVVNMETGELLYYKLECGEIYEAEI